MQSIEYSFIIAGGSLIFIHSSQGRGNRFYGAHSREQRPGEGARVSTDGRISVVAVVANGGTTTAGVRVFDVVGHHVAVKEGTVVLADQAHTHS